MKMVYRTAIVVNGEIQWMNYTFFSTKERAKKDIEKRVNDAVSHCDNLVVKAVACRWDSYRVNECGSNSFQSVEGIVKLVNETTHTSTIFGILEYPLD